MTWPPLCVLQAETDRPTHTHAKIQKEEKRKKMFFPLSPFALIWSGAPICQTDGSLPLSPYTTSSPFSFVRRRCRRERKERSHSPSFPPSFCTLWCMRERKETLRPPKPNQPFWSGWNSARFSQIESPSPHEAVEEVSV